jgi:hypothetical protein
MSSKYSPLLPSGFPTNNLYAFLFSPMRADMPCPSHPLSLDNSNYIWQNVASVYKGIRDHIPEDNSSHRRHSEDLTSNTVQLRKTKF